MVVTFDNRNGLPHPTHLWKLISSKRKKELKIRSSKYPVSRLRNTIEFGTEGPTGEINPNTGEDVTGFVPKRKVHCGTYTLSITATISLAGAALNDTIALVVRHNDELTDLKKYPEARYKGELYRVNGWSIDDQLNAYDVVTLKKTNKH